MRGDERSQQPVPFDELTPGEPQSWRAATMYTAPTDWGFASERVFGKMPIWAVSSLQKVLQPAAKRVKITKRIGWHTFRHTYSSLLSEYGNDVKVVQEVDAARQSQHDDGDLHSRLDGKEAGGTEQGCRCAVWP